MTKNTAELKWSCNQNLRFLKPRARMQIAVEIKKKFIVSAHYKELMGVSDLLLLLHSRMCDLSFV